MMLFPLITRLFECVVLINQRLYSVFSAFKQERLDPSFKMQISLNILFSRISKFYKHGEWFVRLKKVEKKLNLNLICIIVSSEQFYKENEKLAWEMGSQTLNIRKFWYYKKIDSISCAFHFFRFLLHILMPSTKELTINYGPWHILCSKDFNRWK